MTARDIITNALIEIGEYAVGESLPAEDANFGLSKLNRLLDNWNTENLNIYGTTLQEFTLTPNHNPHTIGLAGSDLVVSVARPTKINEANLVLTDVTPPIYRALKVVDESWWMNNPIPTLATQIPYYLYPNFGWPQGQLYLWPVPSFAYNLRLDLWTLLSGLGLDDTFSMPPGYEDAVTLSLGESLLSAFPTAPGGALIRVAAKKAMDRIRSINSEAPLMGCDPAVQSMDSQPKASIANFY